MIHVRVYPGQAVGHNVIAARIRSPIELVPAVDAEPARRDDAEPWSPSDRESERRAKIGRNLTDAANRAPTSGGIYAAGSDGVDLRCKGASIVGLTTGGMMNGMTIAVCRTAAPSARPAGPTGL